MTTATSSRTPWTGDHPLVEKLAVLHAAIYLVACAWGFGGGIYWMHLPLRLWGSLGLIILAWGIYQRWSSIVSRRLWLWLAPWLLLNAWVVASVFNPNLELIRLFDANVYRPIPTKSWLPSCARPDLAWRELWLYNGFFLAGFNLAFLVRRRVLLRRFLAVACVNALVLAVFGTVQKLLDAGLFFGAVTSPNPAYFSTFIYHNHWGAFTLLMVAVFCALGAHHARENRSRDLFHSALPTLIVGIVLLAATIPLSTSRSGTLLVLILLGGAGGRAWWQWVRQRQRHREPVLGWVLGGSLTAALVLTWVAMLAWPHFSPRVQQTRLQWAQFTEAGAVDFRDALYRDTIRMAQERPWTGWGLESYETVFQRFNSVRYGPVDRLPWHYDQAHSDWLQAWAELGWVGTAFLLAMGLIPLGATARAWRRDPVALHLLAGVGLIAWYAWIEFPLANPAVALAFWLTFFAALRHAELNEKT